MRRVFHTYQGGLLVDLRDRKLDAVVRVMALDPSIKRFFQSSKSNWEERIRTAY